MRLILYDVRQGEDGDYFSNGDIEGWGGMEQESKVSTGKDI